MSRADPSSPLVPGFEVRVDGEPLDAELRPHVVGIVVDLDVRVPGMFVLTLAGGESLDEEVPWIDDRELFDIGMSVEVLVGYGSDVEPIFVGEIVALEPDFAADRLPRLGVRALDAAHRLQRSRRTRTFVSMTDSDIARRVAEDAGLTAQVETTDVVHEYVVQGNQTDFEFLRERADAVGYEMFVRNKDLHFRPAPVSEAESVALTWNQELTAFRPRLVSAGQPTETTVRGWDPAAKEPIVGTATESDLEGAMDGEQRAPSMVSEAFGARPWPITDRPVFSAGEADAVAVADLESSAEALVRGRCRCWGRSDLTAGIVVAIEGVGERFGGRYYVPSTVHRYSAAEGYQVDFEIRRNAS